MISLIICSRSSVALAQVSESVASTIGVPYEIIGVDNSSSRYGICDAYNIGAAQARYELLCFMHEDLAFHTQNWGAKVADILANPNAGVLGVAGGTYEVQAPASWNSLGADYIRMNVLHTVRGKTTHDRIGPKEGGLHTVATLDGLWMCCRKTVWEQVKFDSATFPGFHYYDIDFCTRVFPYFTNYVTLDILIEHFSHGSYTRPWFENALHYYDKRWSYLPFGTATIAAPEARRLRLMALQQFIRDYINFGLPLKQALRLWSKCFELDPLNRDSLWLLKKYIFVNIFNKPV